MSRVVSSNKLLGETVNIYFDFISRLALSPTEILSTAVVTCTVYSGVDTSPSSVLSGAASVYNTTTAVQKVTAGVLGVIYELLCTVTTNQGQTLQLSTYLAIIPDLP